MSALTPTNALADLWQTTQLPVTALNYAQLTGSAVLPSSFPIGLTAQTSIVAAALAAAEIGHLRGQARQLIHIDQRHASLEFRSERYQRLNGQELPELWDKIAGLYPCGAKIDSPGWIRLHTNFPHHRDGILRLLQCDYDKQSVTQALQHWRAQDFEQAAADAGMPATALRSFEEWDQHPQGIAVAAQPLISIEKIADASIRSLSRLTEQDRPLTGLRVLDLTRVIAGPVCGRAFAAYGADVMQITAAHLPAMDSLVIDTNRGKLSVQLDLRTTQDAHTLRTLLKETDIFSQGYHPGGLSRLGFSPEELAAIRPGIIYISLSAYGHTGPWATRRGFDSLVQTASGFNVAEAQAYKSNTPKALPAQALDHASGYLMALGALAALHRREQEGGSWHVRVSLARTGQWIRQLGRTPQDMTLPDPDYNAVQNVLETTDSGFGSLTSVRHSAEFSTTPAHWTRPSVPLGTHPACWPSQDCQPTHTFHPNNAAQ